MRLLVVDAPQSHVEGGLLRCLQGRPRIGVGLLVGLAVDGVWLHVRHLAKQRDTESQQEGSDFTKG